MQNLTFRCIDGVAQLAGITNRDLLIPSFLASHLLTLEGIESGNADVQVRQRYRQTGVAHVLNEVERRAKRHAYTGERGTP